MKTFLRVLMWIAIIAIVIFIVLFVSARVAGFGTIPALIRYLIVEYTTGHVFTLAF